MEPCDLTATEARRLMGRKALSARELLESCIGRVDRVDHAVNAVTIRDFDQARAGAAAADEKAARGEALLPLHGLPFGVKDLDDAAGLRTTFGSVLFKDNVAAEDCLMVANTRAAGGIVMGKTNVPEFGAGANTRNPVFGATGNAFDPTKNAAGSSGGSAVALACGMMPLATGSDTGGSLRNPAAFNGVVGFRPSPNVVPNGRRAVAWTPISVLGPMARTVPDVMMLLRAMAALDWRDPLAMALAPYPTVDLATVRAAFTPDYGFCPTEQHVRDVFAGTTGLFRHLFAVAADEHPDCSGTDEVFEVLRRVSAMAGSYDRVQQHADKLGPNVQADVRDGLKHSALDVARAEAHATVLYRRWDAFFERFDVILCPGICTTPRPWTELFPAVIDGKPTRTYFHWLSLSYASTVAACPSVCIPVGRDRDGMPFGIQVVGRRGADAYVLAVAAALEAALAGDPRTARPVPDLDKLAAAPAMTTREGYLGFG